ncbi:DUF2130 domain-containing protein [Winogradskyella poriferorum]|uniref:DUF2130 domain-containing protein n=1 Tax=Winogradskyella poriferorum TaxID=307627 RepID=UPI003D64E5CE
MKTPKTLTEIKCPKCDESIDISDSLLQRVEAQYKANMEERFKSEKAQMEAKHIKALETIKETVRADTEKEQNNKLKALEEDLLQKEERLKAFNQTELEFLKLQRAHKTLKDDLSLDFERKLNEELELERSKIKNQLASESELKIKELEKKLADQVKLTEQMKQKQEQGSMQMQGEVLELALEQFLQQEFPLDNIEEIKKGANGADCLQIVNTHQKPNCGTIYYETKRTKSFSDGWIEKFKADIRDKNASVGVLVSEVLPDDIKGVGQRDGIWICNFASFKLIAHVLRKAVVDINFVEAKNQGKSDKMSLLYNYLTSNEFKMQVEAIVEGFTQMQQDLDSEKRAMKRLWKKREKQLEKVVDSTLAMHGSITGIAGNAIKSIDVLELKQLGESDVE